MDLEGKKKRLFTVPEKISLKKLKKDQLLILALAGILLLVIALPAEKKRDENEQLETPVCTLTVIIFFMLHIISRTKNNMIMTMPFDRLCDTLSVLIHPIPERHHQQSSYSLSFPYQFSFRIIFSLITHFVLGLI